MTTNLPFEQWKGVPGSKRLTGATLDMLTHRGTIVEPGTEGYRLRVPQETSRAWGGAADFGRRRRIEEG